MPDEAEKEDFNPRSPCGERQKPIHLNHSIKLFQSTLPVRGATFVQNGHCPHIQISIHAPRAGSDATQHAIGVVAWFISIHAPRAGSDHTTNPTVRLVRISIHAPRAGSDVEDSTMISCITPFQSTLPVRGATLLKIKIFVR